MKKIIAIDGPSGAGKGTIAKLIAKKLNYMYIDTGAMYRCIALMAIRNNIKVSDEDKIVEILKNMDVKLTNDGKCFLNSEDVSNCIRQNDVTSIVSKISRIVPLRELMLKKQREYAKENNIVMEGRNITTHIFPNADFKFYIDASLEERVRRRYNQNKENNIDLDINDIASNIKQRDYDDFHREVGKLKRCDDQIYIDTTNMSIDEVVNKMLEVIQK